MEGAPVVDGQGGWINYPAPAETTTAVPQKAQRSNRASAPLGEFIPAGASSQRPFWQYAIFGSGIGVSNIVVVPASPGGAAEVIIGGNSGSNFGANDFWHVIRRTPATGNYDQVFVSPIYSAAVKRIAVANVIGDSAPEIAVMLADGRVYLHDLATKTELGHVSTGVNGLEGLSLTDLDGDTRAELIVTTTNDLFVFSAAGNLLWQVPGAGGNEVIVGQMDNDAALEIAATKGVVVDTSTRMAQWTRSGGFGRNLALAPIEGGTTYQQLIAAEAWYVVYAYDVALQLPRWSFNTSHDIGALHVADVDNDSVPEVLIGDNQWGGVRAYDLITRAQKWVVNNPEHGVTDIAIADVDADGVVDVLWGAGWSSTGADRLYVAATNGTRAIKWQSIDLQGPFLGPVLGDLDGDGQLELVACSLQSDSGYSSGRILVFDLATLNLRGISPPVVDNRAWTGVHDLKLRDLEGDGRMEIVVAADNLYDGVVDIYGFSAANSFTRKWINTVRPDGSPFNFVEVADLDGNGTREIIAGNTVAHTGSEGIFLHIYDSPTAAPWRSVNMGSGFGSMTGLVVQDLDGNGGKEIVTLLGNGDRYTFDGPTRQLRSLQQNTGHTRLSSRPNPSGIIGSDSAGVGHFLEYMDNTYTEVLTRQLGSGNLDGINVIADSLWVGYGGTIALRRPPSYSSIAWQSSTLGTGAGRFVATDTREGQNRVFTSARHAVMGLAYSLPEPPVLTAAVSRKNHGLAGTFDIPLPLTGAPAVECRLGGADGLHTLVLTFDAAVVSGRARVSSGTGFVEGDPVFSGNQMSFSLAGVANVQRLTVTIEDVAGVDSPPLVSASFTFGILEGDVNGNGAVTSSDIGQVKALSGQTATNTNFRADGNSSGTINASDVGIAKGRSGTVLP